MRNNIIKANSSGEWVRASVTESTLFSRQESVTIRHGQLIIPGAADESRRYQFDALRGQAKIIGTIWQQKNANSKRKGSLATRVAVALWKRKDISSFQFAKSTHTYAEYSCLRILAQRTYPTKIIRKSITLVLVGPILYKSPSGSKKW